MQFITALTVFFFAALVTALPTATNTTQDELHEANAAGVSFGTSIISTSSSTSAFNARDPLSLASVCDAAVRCSASPV
jgi:hypothetical protein